MQMYSSQMQQTNKYKTGTKLVAQARTARNRGKNSKNNRIRAQKKPTLAGRLCIYRNYFYLIKFNDFVKT